MVDSGKNRLQYCLASKILQDLIVPRMICPASELAPGFPLHHHDISLQNLFVDDNLNITCIIDWAFASTAPLAQLLATPGLPHPRDLVLELSLVAAFRSGFEAENEKLVGRKIECNIWKAGEMVSRFMRLVSQDALQDYHHLEALCALALGPVAEDGTNSLPAILEAQAATAEARTLAEELAADDEPESEVCRREKEYFDRIDGEKHTIARKVALAASRNPRLVVDARLWRWIEAVMEDYNGAEYNGSEVTSEKPTA